MYFLLIITVISALKVISRIFQGFLIPNTYDFTNYELLKPEKPPKLPMWRFWAVFGQFRRFLGSFSAFTAIFLKLMVFAHLALLFSKL